MKDGLVDKVGREFQAKGVACAVSRRKRLGWLQGFLFRQHLNDTIHQVGDIGGKVGLRAEKTWVHFGQGILELLVTYPNNYV